MSVLLHLNFNRYLSKDGGKFTLFCANNERIEARKMPDLGALYFRGISGSRGHHTVIRTVPRPVAFSFLIPLQGQFHCVRRLADRFRGFLEGHVYALGGRHVYAFAFEKSRHG